MRGLSLIYSSTAQAQKGFPRGAYTCSNSIIETPEQRLLRFSHCHYCCFEQVFAYKVGAKNFHVTMLSKYIMKASKEFFLTV